MGHDGSYCRHTGNRHKELQFISFTVKVLPSADTYFLLYELVACLWLTSLALLRTEKGWYQQSLANASNTQWVSLALIRQFNVWKQKEVLLLHMRCWLYPSEAVLNFLYLRPCWKSLTCDSIGVSAVFWVGEHTEMLKLLENMHW